jgi:hypothetical protein
VRAGYHEFNSSDDIRLCIAALKPRTAIVDTEPLVAYWDTTVEVLDRGLTVYAAEMSQVPSLEHVVFATNP